MADIGNATRFGILICTGDTLERLSNIKRIAFDKTGTLTYGKPEVTVIKSFSPKISENDLLAITASAEQHFEHPLGRSILNFAKDKVELSNPLDFILLPGKGVSATVNNKYILAGNKELFFDKNIDISSNIMNSSKQYIDDGCTVIFVSIENEMMSLH